MIPALDPAAIRALTVRLVKCRSVSPDVLGETRCAREIEAALPATIERGEWCTPDGRPVVWAYAPGLKPETVVLLGHYDTVGVGEYGALGDPAGEAIAFDPDALRERLIERLLAEAPLFGTNQVADLHAEEREPGTWLFGRGALDMKSGVAVGVAVLTGWAAREPKPECGVLFIATPDEEYESAGMVAALRGLRALRDARALTLLGVLNLDTVSTRTAYVGAMGKIELGCYVIGRPTHAGAPMLGIDAAELAAGIVTRMTRSRVMVDECDGVRSVPAVALRLRDLKEDYNIQTAREAWVEFILITVARPLDETFRSAKSEAMQALHELLSSHLDLSAWLDPVHDGGMREVKPVDCVMTYAELCEAAELPAGEDPLGATPHTMDPRTATLARLRELARRAGLGGPAVIFHLLPPYYPHVAPGDGPLVRATHEVLAGERGVTVRPYYPLVSDACYAAWRTEPIGEIARQMPSLGREYTLPHEDAGALDLDVVNFGPWGHDLHGLLERVHAGWTFERLPELVWKILDRLCQLGAAAAPNPIERNAP